MKLLCKFYRNNVRLCSGVAMFSTETGFKFFCLEGTLVKQKDEYRVLTPTATVMMSCVSQKTRKNVMMLLTTNPKYADRDNQYVDSEDIVKTSIYPTLCLLLKDKFEASKNKFSVGFKCEDAGATAVVTAEVDENSRSRLVCVLTSPKGEVMLTGDDAVFTALSRCQDIKSFEFTSVTPDVEKTISVRKSRGEIYREVAHYFNKTLVLVSFVDSDKIMEQYVSSTSILQCVTRTNGVRTYRKISPIVFNSAQPVCAYLTSATIEDIAREQGRALRHE